MDGNREGSRPSTSVKSFELFRVHPFTPAGDFAWPVRPERVRINALKAVHVWHQDWAGQSVSHGGIRCATRAR